MSYYFAPHHTGKTILGGCFKTCVVPVVVQKMLEKGIFLYNTYFTSWNFHEISFIVKRYFNCIPFLWHFMQLTVYYVPVLNRLIWYSYIFMISQFVFLKLIFSFLSWGWKYIFFFRRIRLAVDLQTPAALGQFPSLRGNVRKSSTIEFRRIAFYTVFLYILVKSSSTITETQRLSNFCFESGSAE